MRRIESLQGPSGRVTAVTCHQKPDNLENRAVVGTMRQPVLLVLVKVITAVVDDDLGRTRVVVLLVANAGLNLLIGGIEILATFEEVGTLLRGLGLADLNATARIQLLLHRLDVLL